MATRSLIVDVEIRGARAAERQMDRMGQAGARLRGTLMPAGVALASMARAAGGLGLVTGALITIRKTVFDVNATLETSTLQFETLMGSAEDAERHVASLFQFAQRTPFETGPIIEASRLLQVMGGDALNTMENLRLLGDTAAATGSQFPELAVQVGRLHASLAAGAPIGEYTRRLVEIGAISPNVAMALNDMAKAGGQADDAFRLLQQSFAEFAGSMEKQADTLVGVTSSLIENLGQVAAKLGRPIFEASKVGLRAANQATSDFKDGLDAIVDGARLTGQAILGNRDAFTELAAAVVSTSDAYKDARTSAVGTKDDVDRLTRALGPSGVGLSLSTTSATDALAEMDRAMGSEGVSKSAREAAESVQRVTQETQRLNERFRESITSLSAISFGWSEAKTQEELWLGLQPTVQGAVGQTKELMVRWRTEGIIPTTESFAHLSGDVVPQLATNLSQANLEMMKSPSIMQQVGAGLVGLKDQFLNFDNVVSGIMQGAFGPGGFIASLAQQGISKLTSLITTGLGKIGGAFKRLFGGPSAKELAGREIVENFQHNIAQMLTEQQQIAAGGELWKQVNIGVGDAYIQAGLSAEEAARDVGNLYDKVKEGPNSVIPIIDMIRAKMEGVRSAAQGAASAVRSIGSAAASVRVPSVSSSIPQMAEGGIVRRPTLAMIGERGPEAVVPLSRSGPLGGLNLTINVNGGLFSDRQSIGHLADRINRETVRQMQRRRQL